MILRQNYFAIPDADKGFRTKEVDPTFFIPNAVTHLSALPSSLLTETEHYR
jgi:hypothetical protein